MVVDVITHGEVQCCAFCQGSVAQEVTVIFGAIEAYFAYIAVQPFTFLAAFPAAISAAIHAILRHDPDSLAVLQITKFGASPPSLTAENPVVFSEHHHPKTLKTL